MNNLKNQKINQYFEDFHPLNPALLLGFIILTFGIYIIPWLYVKNKEFELVAKNFAPNSFRNPILFFVFPFSWFYIIYIIKLLIFDNLFVKIIQIFGWFIIYILILKYVYDFCFCFGKITKTLGIYWFIIFLIGSFGIFGIFLNKILIMPFCIFLLILIPSMQAELNSYFDRLKIRRKTDIFYENFSVKFKK